MTRYPTRRPALEAGQIRLLRGASQASVLVALTLIALKGWAWGATDSVALLSSLADSILDLLASVVTFLAVRVAALPADQEHRFGHGKSEGVSSIVQAVIVAGSAGYVGLEAIVRLAMPVPVRQPDVGIAVMLASMALTAVLVLFQSYVVRRTGSMAIAADSVHYRADLLTTFAVLAAIIASARWELYVLDPLLGLVVVAVILVSVRGIASRALDVLLDRELPDEDRERIYAICARHPEVGGLHDLRTRSSGIAQFIQLHLELDPGLSLAVAHQIGDAVEQDIRRAFPAAEVLIHVDPLGLAEERDPF